MPPVSFFKGRVIVSERKKAMQRIIKIPATVVTELMMTKYPLIFSITLGESPSLDSVVRMMCWKMTFSAIPPIVRTRKKDKRMLLRKLDFDEVMLSGQVLSINCFRPTGYNFF